MTWQLAVTSLFAFLMMGALAYFGYWLANLLKQKELEQKELQQK